jgi:hypothetical protein
VTDQASGPVDELWLNPETCSPEGTFESPRNVPEYLFHELIPVFQNPTQALRIIVKGGEP